MFLIAFIFIVLLKLATISAVNGLTMTTIISSVNSRSGSVHEVDLIPKAVIIFVTGTVSRSLCYSLRYSLTEYEH